jgi:DNA-binding Lrp family transcriptional regulator
VLKSQDVLVVLKLALSDEPERTFAQLAAAVGMSASETHAAVKRATACGLIDAQTRAVRKTALLEFLLHGLRYVFPPEWRGVTRGVPTSYAAPPLSSEFSIGDLPPVWSHPDGTSRGEALVPLYKSAPAAALRDPALYEWLALVDALRAGRARERRMAASELERRLSG